MLSDKPDSERIAERVQRDVDVPWDDVRAARVQKSALEAFRAARREDEARAEQEEATHEAELAALEKQLDTPPRRWLWWTAAPLVIAAAAMLMLWLRAPGETAATAWVVASLDYRDGSRALLSDSAQVQVLDDEPQRVVVRQRAGRVRYEVTERPERRFQVGAHEVTITVLGTVFDVDVAARSVSVEVTRGRVQVDHAQPDGSASQVILTTGQRITIATSGAEVSANERHDGAAEASPAAPGADGDASPEVATPEVAPVVVGTAAGSAVANAADLFRQADEARASGNDALALMRLRTLVANHPRDPRVHAALFTLGRILRKQGKHAEAARAFEQCGAALHGDAMAEAASAWHAAGDAARAQTAAERYLGMFPRGVHAEHMRKLVPAGSDGGS